MKSMDNKNTEAPYSWMDNIDSMGWDGGMDEIDALDAVIQSEAKKAPEVKQGSFVKDVAEIDVYLHASSAFKIMAGSYGLTDIQEDTLKGYLERIEGHKAGALDSKGKKITKLPPSYETKMIELVDKRDNPKLGKTLKTYIEEYLTAKSYGVEKNTDSKYTGHGIANEPFSITMLNEATGQNFVKCDETKVNDELLLKGTADIDSDELDAIIDMKNPYDVFTFDKNRDFEITDVPTGDKNVDKAQKEYYDQMQSYMVLYNRPRAYLVFVLNENDWMAGDEYDDYGVLDRFVIKKVDRDPAWEIEYRRRLPGFKDMILDAKIRAKESVLKTADYLKEMSTETKLIELSKNKGDDK